MYADVDFLLALAKEKDWLKENAERIYRKHRQEIWTSTLALIEVLLLAHREKVKADELLKKVHFLITVKEIKLGEGEVITAADLMDKFKATPFDALHAILCGNDKIISSDKKFDKMGLRRVKLEVLT